MKTLNFIPSTFALLLIFIFSTNLLQAESLPHSDTFSSSSNNGYSVDDGDSNELQVNGTHTSVKTYSLNSNAQITISFELKRRSSRWENADCISVQLNGAEVLGECKNNLTTGYTTYTYDTQAQASGDFTVTFANNANRSNEWIKVDNILIEARSADEITSFSAPSEVTQGETITVTVAYDVSEEREIVTGFQQNHSPWTGWGWTTVNVTGTGTVDISVVIPSDQPAGNTYQIPIVLQPLGGNWDSRLDVESVNPVNLVSIVCNGCDCSLDDNNVNNTADGVTIPSLNGATGDVSKCISGSTAQSDSSADKEDYYTFSVSADGTLDITTLSPNSHDFHFWISKNDTEIYPDTTSQVHAIPTISLSSGDKIVVWFKETGDNFDEYQATFDFTATTSPTIENTNDLCYEEFTESGLDLGFIGFFMKTKMPIKNLNNEDLTNVEVALGSSSLFSAFRDCGVEDGTGTCEDASGKSFMMFSAFNNGVAFNLEDLSQNESVTPYTESIFSFFNSNNYDMVGSYMKNGVLHQGKLKACPVSYCEKNNLAEGFRIIDPDGGESDNSFEIFCHEDSNNIWHDLLALPIKNSSNNFSFNNDATNSNYYDTSGNPRTHFNAVEIDGGHITYTGTTPSIPVVTARSDEPWSITTATKSYKVMGSVFSNINLIGTPFTINWDETDELLGCDESKLRKALGQAVKYNTINNGTSNDGQSRCKINSMNLSLLDDYRFLVYNGSEVLQHSCKEMATYIPNNLGILNDADVAGHFNILTTEPAYPNEVPTTNGTRNNSTDIGEKLRPLTTYCKYQEDLAYVWTFLTALDAEVTQYKTDLVTKSDTCSQLGLYFYVPNTKETFDRVRKYLKGSKTGDNGWENYTGTIEEKIRSLTSSNAYYLSEFKDVQIWPYGPFGVYLHSGNKSAPRAPMHNIATMSNYPDSLGKKGWVSILGSQDLNKTDEWWISDIGAGLEITKDAAGLPSDTATYDPHGIHPKRNNTYDEPNGNYTYDAWYNFLYDEEGWVYHNDDWNANYPYYDYMCMSETNYDTASRYTLIPGFFNAIERATNANNTAPYFSDTDIRTKIVAKDMSLDVLLYKINTDGTINRSALNVDENKSVGVFLSSVEDPNPPVPIQYLGEFEDFAGQNGRISIPNFNVTSAQKRVVVQFYYCNASGQAWTDCWSYSNSGGSILLSSIGNGDKADSTDDFAIRPKRFSMITPGSNVVKAENVDITYYAYNELDQASVGYNESFSNLNFNTTLADPTKAAICPNTTLNIMPTAFTDGIDINQTKLATVGIWNVQISEIDGSEFANIDFDDTSDIDRFITPADINLTILPSYFNLVLTANVNNGSNFTYLSNDLDNMAINFDFNVTAKNSDNLITPNYSVGCYSNNVNVDLIYGIQSSVGSPAAFSNLIIYKEINSNITGNNAATDNALALPQGGDVLPASLFTAVTRGNAEISLRINFQRNLTTALNPFKVNFSDLNVSDQTYAPVITSNETTHTIDKNATMIYGRTHGQRQRFTNNTSTAFIYYEAYCSATDASGTLCNKSLLPNQLNSQITDDPRWFRNSMHSTPTNGTAGDVSQKNSNSITGTTVTNNNPAQTTLTYIHSATKGYPYKATMENNASSWLIYNRFDATLSDTTNEFEVEFDSAGGAWAGKHDTNTTTNQNASSKTNRRSMW